MNLLRSPLTTIGILTCLLSCPGGGATGAPRSAHFEPNLGQADERWPVLMRNARYEALLGATELTLMLSVAHIEPPVEPDLPPTITYDTQPIRLTFVGADDAAQIRPEAPLSGRSNYFSRQKNLIDVPHFTGARTRQVYPGIDLRYLIDEGDLRYDLILAPDADTKQVRIKVTGAQRVALAADGSLEMTASNRVIRQRAPVVFQELDGERTIIDAHYVLHDDHTISFSVADYDQTNALVIDPSLDYSTYFGGSGIDSAGDMALAPNGDVITCGNTTSIGLASLMAAQPTLAGDQDILVTRSNDTGVVFSTYLGGSDSDTCARVALDSDQNVIIAGTSRSSDYPTPMGFDTTFAGGGLLPRDGIVTKLSANGQTILFSTYVGGLDLAQSVEPFLVGLESIRGLVIDGDDNIYVAGNTSAADFPATTTALLGRACGADNPPASISTFVSDQFVARFDPVGNLDFASCLGGDARDTGRALHVDEDGLIFLGGATRSANYPIPPGDFDQGSSTTNFYSSVVTVLNEDATILVSSARIGGTGNDFLQEIAVDDQGRVIATGFTSSADFPTTAGVLQPGPGSIELSPGVLEFSDAFVFRTNLLMTDLDYATYLGGIGDEVAFSLALDDNNPVISFQTDSYDLPTPNGIQTQKAGDIDAARAFGTGANTQVFASGNRGPDNTEYVIAGRDGLNELFALDANNELVSLGALDSDAQNTRDIVIGDLNRDFDDDLIVANAGGANQLYLSDGIGAFGPGIPFGDPMSPTSHVGLITYTDSATMAIVEFIDGQINQQYVFDNQSGTLLPPIPYGNAAISSIDVEPANELTLVELRQPDQIAIYRADGSSTQPFVELVDLPGANLVDLDIARVSERGFEALIGADANGGILLIFDLVFPDRVVVTVDGLPTVAVAGISQVGVIGLTPDGYQYYRVDSTGAITLRQTQQGGGPLQALHVADFALNQMVVTSDSARDRVANVGLSDLYLARLSPDASELTFGTYLGGNAAEIASWGLQISAPGQAVLAGASTSTNFPIANGFQSANAGIQNQVIARITMVDPAPDEDQDGIPDEFDSCIEVANADQRDTNADGFGNACDPDLDNDGTVNVVDLGLLRSVFFATPDDANWDRDADLNGDDVVNTTDLGVLRSFFFGPPGPSGLVP